MLMALGEMALVILMFVGLYTLPALPWILGIGFIVWLIKH